MGEEDDKEVLRLLRAARAKKRGYADFFEWRIDRDREELGVVQALEESLQFTGKSFFSRVIGRGRGEDPPDCEALTLEGKRMAIEVTELVDEDAIRAFRRGQGADWAPWSRNQLFDAVSKLLAKKDSRYPDLKGGPYPGGYMVVIYTDEPLLSRSVLSSYLAGLTFDKLVHVDRAFVLISYDPEVEHCPAIELPLVRS